MKRFLYRLAEIFKLSYTGSNLLLQVLAIILTAIIVSSGFDWYYFLAVRNQTLNTFFFPALPVGFFLPIILPALLLLVGYLTRNKRIVWYGSLLAHAAFAGWFLSSAYKALTGRVQPNLLNTAIDGSRNFNFGFFEHGIFWGWPSSHTAVAFATMVALFLSLPKHRLVRWVAIVYAFYIGIGVSLSIHWFSEFVAGALIGTAVGISVEELWRKKTPEVLYLRHMKNSIIIIVIAVLLLGGAYVYVTKNGGSAGVPAAPSTEADETSMLASPETDSEASSVHISKIDTAHEADATHIVYKGTGSDIIAMEVTGSVKNVKLVSVELNGAELSVKDTVKEFGDMKDATLYITTTIPEGVPTEMLTWQSESGANYSWIVGANGATNTVDRTYTDIR